MHFAFRAFASYSPVGTFSFSSMSTAPQDVNSANMANLKILFLAMSIGMMTASAVIYADDDNVSEPHVRMFSRFYLVDYNGIQFILIVLS